MPDDLLPPETPAPLVPTPDPVPRSTRVTCEFCGCQLDPKGNVLLRGEPARAYLDLEDANRKLQERIDIQEGRITELSGQLDALKTPERKRGGFLGNI
jgi:hypothetical protein